MINIQENAAISDEQKNEIINECANELQNLRPHENMQLIISHVRTWSLVVNQIYRQLRGENLSDLFALIEDNPGLKQKLITWRRLYLQNAEIYKTDLKLRIGLIHSGDNLFNLAKNLLVESCGITHEELRFLHNLLQRRGMPTTQMEAILLVITQR